MKNLVLSLWIVVGGVAVIFAQTPSLMNPQISLNGLFAVGGSTAAEESIPMLQGGGHDPQHNGFNVQNIELSLTSAVDPYLNGEAHFVFHPAGVEIEELFFTTSSLPAGLQLKGGSYLTEFGRLNHRHPHTWHFVDQPVIYSRLIGGEGLRNPGLRLSWLPSLPFYSEFYLGVQNSEGETAVSFIGADEDEEEHGHAHGLRDDDPEHLPRVNTSISDLSDLIYAFRWLNSVDVSQTITTNIGVSLLTGPNATSETAITRIGGVDLLLKWKPLSTERGFPFVQLQGEWLWRDYEVAEFFHEEDNELVPAQTLTDSGFYGQIAWGFQPGWVVGMRAEQAKGDAFSQRSRYSANLSWYPSEFSKFRLQYNYDDDDRLPDPAHTVWFQYEFMMGAHAAHTF